MTCNLPALSVTCCGSPPLFLAGLVTCSVRGWVGGESDWLGLTATSVFPSPSSSHLTQQAPSGRGGGGYLVVSGLTPGCYQLVLAPGTEVAITVVAPAGAAEELSAAAAVAVAQPGAPRPVLLGSPLIAELSEELPLQITQLEVRAGGACGGGSGLPSLVVACSVHES